MSPVRQRVTLYCWAVAVGFALYLVIHLFVLIDAYSVNVPWWDNFTYYFLLAHANLCKLFTARVGPHREGLSLILSSIIAPLSHWNMRAEAFAIGVILTLATLILLWTKKRAFGYLSAADFLVIPAILLSPRESYHWCFVINSAHSALPVLLLALYCLGCTIKSPTKRDLFIIAVTFFSVFTGFAIFIGIIALATFTSRRKWLFAGLVGGIFLLFLLDYRFDPSVPNFRFFDPNTIRFLPYSLAVGIANICGFGQPPTNQLIGYPLLAAILAALILSIRPFVKGDLRATIIASLIGFGLLFMLFALEGRISLGRDCLIGSRYVPLISPVFLGLYLSITQFSAVWPKAVGLTLVTSLAIYASSIASNGEVNSMPRLQATKAHWVQTYLATNNFDAADRAAVIPIYPHPRPADVQEDVEYLKTHRLGFFYDPPQASKPSR
jgi:hypothetical protein